MTGAATPTPTPKAEGSAAKLEAGAQRAPQAVAGVHDPARPGGLVSVPGVVMPIKPVALLEPVPAPSPS